MQRRGSFRSGINSGEALLLTVCACLLTVAFLKKDASFFLTIEVFFLMVCLFYLHRTGEGGARGGGVSPNRFSTISTKGPNQF